MEKRILIIKASEWDRGKKFCDGDGDPDYGRLLRENARASCCLGLDALARGIPDSLVLGLTTPVSLKLLIDGEPRERETPFAEYFTDWCEEGRNNEDAVEAMHINDQAGTTDEEKIHHLRPLFMKHGIEIDWRPNE